MPAETMSRRETDRVHELVAFHVGNEDYAVDIRHVQEINRFSTLITLPQAPEFIEGVLNLRGEVMPVIDLRERFGLPGDATIKSPRIIITPIAGVPTGLVVDAVDEVRSVDQRKLEDPPKVTSGGANAYIQKVAKTPGGVIFILEIQQLLSDVEGRQLEAFQGKRRVEP